MEKLTVRQKQVFDFISGFIRRHRYPPTLREIATGIGTSGTISAIRHLDTLEQKGYIRRDAGSSRGITLTYGAEEGLGLPIVGVVNAGTPVLAFENIEGYYPFDEVRANGGAFFLRVRGDSMIEDAILDGDLVLVRATPTANNGDIVVAMIGSEVTLKRFYLERGRVRLQPSNSRMEAIFVSPEEDLAIVGKVIKVLREIE